MITSNAFREADARMPNLQVASESTLPFFDREGHLSADGRFH